MAPATPGAEEVATPEHLRGSEGEKALNISLVSSPPPPTPPLDLTKTSDHATESECEVTRECDCTTECDTDDEADYHNKLFENRVRLNTRDPHWGRVFPCRKGRCRFCSQPCTPDDVGQCAACEPMTIFQAVKKYAPRWRYPTN